MWGMWMFTIPSLRARECTDAEKDALNLLFLAVPLLNVAIPFFAKSFPLIFTADCVLMAVRGARRACARRVGAGTPLACLRRCCHVGWCADAAAASNAAFATTRNLSWAPACSHRCCPTAAWPQGVYAWKGLIPGIGGEQKS